MENSSIKLNKEYKKLLKKVKKMSIGDEIDIRGCCVLCCAKEVYLIIGTNRIYERNYNQIEDWLINGGDLE